MDSILKSHARSVRRAFSCLRMHKRVHAHDSLDTENEQINLLSNVKSVDVQQKTECRVEDVF